MSMSILLTGAQRCSDGSAARLLRVCGRVFAPVLFSVATLAAMPAIAAPLPGAIFTTDKDCSGVDLNIYGAKTDVYLNGGPNSKPGAAGLPDGYYYVQVTDPSGADLLGSSGSTAPVQVINGVFAQCYKLADLVTPFVYLDTTNNGGEYKVWVSTAANFINDSTKTDNFKVRCKDSDPNCNPVTGPQGELIVRKFYDANANGVFDTGEAEIFGWKVNILGTSTAAQDKFTRVDSIVDPDTFTVFEYDSIVSTWLATTPKTVSNVVVSFAPPPVTVDFGNVCLAAGGGLTLGFWSNKNGMALVNSTDLSFLTTLYLRNANGSDFNPATAGALSKWLLAATATNMANMLSAQLTAMELNVRHGFVSAAALIYAPGTDSASALGFATVAAVMSEAETSLLNFPNTTASGANRTKQEAIKNALDNANNNRNFVQATPCAFDFN